MKRVLPILALPVMLGGCGSEQSPPAPKPSPPPRAQGSAESRQQLFDPANRDHQLIEIAIRREIKKPTGDLTEADLFRVTSLYLPDQSLTDITPIASLAQLRSLNLANNKLTDLTSIAKLSHLRILHLSSNRVGNLSALRGLTGMDQLWLDNNRITDLTPLTGMTHAEPAVRLRQPNRKPQAAGRNEKARQP